MKKEKFEKCNLELLLFSCKDVITTSNDGDSGEEPIDVVIGN